MHPAGETLSLPGLGAEAEILVDRWGIPHIYAASQRDAFFVQGFNAARDRLWQIDLWRKRGLGLMAGDLGPAYAERDRAARLLLYRGDMAAEWACYGADAELRTTAFVAGINAYIDLLEREPARLPMEFRALGTRPARWSPEDVVRCRAHARVRNLDSEVTRATIVARFGLETDRLHKGLQPEWRVQVPQGLEPHVIPPEVMRTYLLGCEPHPIDGADPAEPLAEAGEWGSNNWALSPARTATGRAILASDPHRVHDQPSLRYIAHLVAPGLDVIGAGEPAIPGVSLGHNDRLAFSLTIHPADQEDLYVHELNEADPDLYRYGEGWERMRVVTESIPVRGGDPIPTELRFTRHGPVLHVDRAARRAYALRSVWWEPGTAAYMASLAYLTAGSFEEYQRALEGWGAPSTNHVVADVDGHIGWQAAAKIPVRPSWDGLMPVPGDGRHEWAGTIQASSLPCAKNPDCGWLGSANQMNLPPDFDHRRHKTGFEWTDGARYARLSEALAGDRRWSVEETLALQTDVLSMPARRLCALLAGAGGTEAAEARAFLAGWDHRLEAGSGPAALFEIWFTNHLMPAIPKALGPEGLDRLIGVPDTALYVELLEAAKDAGFGPAPKAARDTLLLDTLAAAWAEARQRMGDETASWSWGRIHQGYFSHPLSRLAPPELTARLDVGPAPKGGSNLTINNNGYRGSDFRVMSGASWRMVLDVGNWDASWTINAPGQSGDPASPHYRDLFPLWAKDEYVPLLYSRTAVEGAVERRIRLLPGG
ncbi:penicillin acylase family protein [Roseomonas eburnea]|uniref:Penicillin acylase family protein n=1 Tax=Neoroseomonas eburnea TaxID=1346889 RepID=A0A9X9XFX7_9PROT|nr:penicillin acylase family protein [Neoroseomonas eburnea]MBR0682613.1 penicillin acylase family protein [Neoroseomonas eburnea]